MSKLKIICIILIIQIITMTNITAESPMSENYISEQLGFYSKLSFIIKKQDNKIKLIKKDFDWHGEYIKFYDYSTVENIKENKDGFPELKIWGTDVLFLYGGGRAIIFDRNINWENPSTFLFSDAYGPRKDFDGINEITNVWDKGRTTYILKEEFTRKNTNGVILSCTSNLKDKSKSYNIKNIENNFILYNDHWPYERHDKAFLFNSTLIPWAEAENGSGIGVSIDVEFVPNEFSKPDEQSKKKCKSFVIMNGYVDFFRTDLYKKNNRVKKIQIESMDSEEKYNFDYILEDTPNFQEIQLPRYTKKIKITILDVYKGTDYDDTCISGIMTAGMNYYEIDKTVDITEEDKNYPFYSYEKRKSIQTEPDGY